MEVKGRVVTPVLSWDDDDVGPSVSVRTIHPLSGKSFTLPKRRSFWSLKDLKVVNNPDQSPPFNKMPTQRGVLQLVVTRTKIKDRPKNGPTP